MKKLKKVIALLLVGIVAFTMTVPSAVIAATNSDGSIEIQGTKKIGKIEAYQIFTVDNEKTGKEAYTIKSPFEQFFQSGTYQSADPAQKLMDIQNGTNAEKVAFSKAVLAWVKEKGTPATKTVGAEDGTTTISGLEYGFYMIYTPEALGEKNDISEKTPAMMITVANSVPVEAVLKSAYPSVDKRLADGNAAGDYQIGDTITYTLTSKVPDMTGLKDYTFKFHDTFSSGLTFKEITSVTVGGAPINEGVGEKTYTKTTAGSKLTIELNDFYNSYKDSIGDKIVVTYKFTLNENASVGIDPNTNKANLEYGHDGIIDASADSVADVHTFGFNIFKFYKEEKKGDPKGYEEKGLAGAEFTLHSAKPCNSDNLMYLSKSTKTDTWNIANGKSEYHTIVTPANGRVHIHGLKSGTYYLEETKAPAGYHKLTAPIEIDIKANYDKEHKKLVSYDVDYTYEGKTVKTNVTGSNLATVKVENRTGSFLPNTGGMGTIIFTVIAIALIACVAASYLKSKRKENEE